MLKLRNIEVVETAGDVVECLTIIVPEEGRVSRQEYVADHSHRPHVSLGGDVVVVDNLRSQELCSSTHRLLWFLSIEFLCCSKVNDLDLVISATHNVLRLK